MAHAAVTDEEKLGLSPEEVAALEGDLDEITPDLNDDDDPDDDPDVIKDDEGKQKDPDPGIATDDKPKDAEPIQSDDFQPIFKADPVEGFDEKVKGLKDLRATTLQDFKDGEIDITEYHEALNQINDDIRELNAQQDRYQLSEDQSKQAGEQRWQWEQDRFFGIKENAAYQTDKILGVAFDAAVKDLANDSANEGKKMSWFLEEADRVVRERFIVPGKKPLPKKDVRKPDYSKIPPNLGDLPSADLNDVGRDDEFARLDKLGGMELESALAKMSPDQAKRYLEG